MGFLKKRKRIQKTKSFDVCNNWLPEKRIPPSAPSKRDGFIPSLFAWNSWRGIEPPTFEWLQSKGVQNPGVRYSPEHPDTARSRAPVAPRSGLGPLTAADPPVSSTKPTGFYDRPFSVLFIVYCNCTREGTSVLTAENGLQGRKSARDQGVKLPPQTPKTGDEDGSQQQNYDMHKQNIATFRLCISE